MEVALNYSVVYFAVALAVQLSACVYLLSLKSKPDYVRYFAAYLAGWCINSCAWIGFASFQEPGVVWFYLAGMSSVLLLTYFLNLFAYSFCALPGMAREFRIFRWFGGLVLAAPFLYFLWRFPNIPTVFVASRETFGVAPGHAFRFFGVTGTSAAVYALFLFIRKALLARRLGLTAESRSLRALALTCVLMSVDFGTFTLLTFGIGDYSSFLAVHSISVNAALLIEVAILLNAVPEHTSLLAKVAGVSLVVCLTLVSVLARVAFRAHDALLQDRTRSAALVALSEVRAVRNRDPEIEFVLSRGPNGETRVLHDTLGDSGLVSARFPPTVGQGFLAFAVGEAPDTNRCYKAVAFRRGDQTIIAGRRLRTHIRKHVQPLTLKFLLSAFAACAFCLGLLPLFFRRNLMRPLRLLMGGVQRVESGDYTTLVPVSYSDEVGQLTRSFNGMVEALGRYRTERSASMDAIHQRQLELERARVEAGRAQAALLKRAIQPHFVMNSLASIVDLLRQDPVRAEQMVLSLGGELRTMLNVIEEQTVPASVELGLCRAHVQIMSFRQADAHSIEVRGFSGTEHLPPFLFHTMVENAFTHRSGSGPIRLRIERSVDGADEVFTFQSSDTSDPQQTERTGSLFIRSSLEENYPGAWELQTDRSSFGFRLKIRIRGRAPGSKYVPPLTGGSGR